MASDITLAVGDGSRRMTYAELATVRGTSLPSARRLVLRHRWPRQTGNDGVVRILVPLRFVQSPSERAALAVVERDRETVRLSDSDMSERPSDATSHPVVTTGDMGSDSAATVLSRAFDVLREQLEHERQRADSLQAKLDDATTAERIARDEAAGLRTELDQLQARGLWARLRNRR